MKFELHDIVRVTKGIRLGQEGKVVGSSVTTRGGLASMSEYQVQLKDVKVTEEFQEDSLVFVSKPVVEISDVDVRRAALIERRRAMEEKKKALELEIAELKEEENMKAMEDTIKILEEQKQKLISTKT